MFVTSSKAAVAALTVTDYEIPTLNFKRMSINEILHTAPDYNLSCPKDGLSRTHLPSEQWAFFSQYHLPEEILKHLGNGRLFCILLVSA